jgi:predicted chitinase
MSKNGYNPNPEYVDAIVKVTNEEMESLEEAAMFLAQTGHESGGFEHIEEIDCAGSTSCADQYGGSEGAPGKSYHGRGFIQLSWPANYKEASEALGMGDELFENPEKVAEDPEIGAKVSSWFWKTKVATAPGVSDNQFGATTKAINGALECTGSNVEKSQNRYKVYKDVAEVLGISNLADEGGCY